MNPECRSGCDINQQCCDRVTRLCCLLSPNLLRNRSKNFYREEGGTLWQWLAASQASGAWGHAPRM